MGDEHLNATFYHQQNTFVCIIYLLKAYSPVNRTQSPRGFVLVQVLHK